MVVFFPTKTLLHFPGAANWDQWLRINFVPRSLSRNMARSSRASSDGDFSSIPLVLRSKGTGKRRRRSWNWGRQGQELTKAVAPTQPSPAPSREQSHSFGPYYLGDDSRVFSLPGAGRGSWGKGCACGHQLIFRQRQEAFFVCMSVLREFQGWNKATLFHYFPSGRGAQAAQYNFIPAVI